MKPLDGITVALTRPSHQAMRLSQALEQQGAEVLEMPAMTIEPVHHAIDEAVEYDWVFFISSNAVRCLHSPDLQAQVVAIGQQTASALVEKGYRVSLVPSTGFTTEDVLALPDLTHLEGQRCLIVRGVGGRETLYQALESRGADVDYVDVYRRVPVTEVNPASWQALLDSSKPVLMFTSGDSLRYFRSALDESGCRHFDRLTKILGSQRIAGVARVSDDPDATVVIADDPSDHSMMNALCQWAELEASKK